MIGVGLKGKKRVSPLQFLMLIQLKERPKYGYEILQALREHFMDVWEPKTGTIYPALRSLKVRGFVETENIDDVNFYKLTKAGDMLLTMLGDSMETELMFADRYYDFVTKWMPRSMKDKVIEMLRKLAKEEIYPPVLIERFLDEAVDSAIKLEVLGNLRRLLENRMSFVEKMIGELQEGKER